MEQTIDKIYGYIIQYGLNIVGAVAIFIIGRWVAQFVSTLLGNALLKTKVDQTLASFGKHLSYYGIMTFVFIAALNKMGVETGSFIAVVGAASLAVGLALQGSLSNFSAGVMLMLFHPFKVGDIVEAGGAQGRIEEIQIFNTVIVTLDGNKRMIVKCWNYPASFPSTPLEECKQKRQRFTHRKGPRHDIDAIASPREKDAHDRKRRAHSRYKWRHDEPSARIHEPANARTIGGKKREQRKPRDQSAGRDNRGCKALQDHRANWAQRDERDQRDRESAAKKRARKIPDFVGRSAMQVGNNWDDRRILIRRNDERCQKRNRRSDNVKNVRC